MTSSPSRNRIVRPTGHGRRGGHHRGGLGRTDGAGPDHPAVGVGSVVQPSGPLANDVVPLDDLRLHREADRSGVPRALDRRDAPAPGLRSLDGAERERVERPREGADRREEADPGRPAARLVLPPDPLLGIVEAVLRQCAAQDLHGWAERWQAIAPGRARRYLPLPVRGAAGVGREGAPVLGDRPPGAVPVRPLSDPPHAHPPGRQLVELPPRSRRTLLGLR